MSQRTLDEYVNEERQVDGMAVNPPSLFLKRCREAQKVHGNDSAYYPTYAIRVYPKMQPAVCDGFGGGGRSSSVGSSTDSNNDSGGEGKEHDLGADGQCKK